MAHQVVSFSNAYSAWENWNLTDFDSKIDGLLSLKNAMSESQYSAVIGFHIEQAANLLSLTHELVGPTGESNELYTSGRGVSLLVVENNSEAARLAALAQCVAALVAGNSVVMCSDDVEFTQQLDAAYQQSSLPTNVLHFTSLEASQQLLESDVRVVGFVGTQVGERKLNQALASRTGSIVRFVSETDLTHLTSVHDPHLSLQFITERTRTINITAVGGNATLLGALDAGK